MGIDSLLIYVFIILISSISGCSIFGPGRVDSKAKHYDFQAPKGDWKFQKTTRGDADALYLHQKTGAILSIHSLCYRYEDANLNSLMNSLLSPISKPELIHEEERTIINRGALYRKVSGKMDGVPVEIAAVVLRKNHCLFDVFLQKSGSLNEEEEAGMEYLLSTLEYPSRKNL